MDKTFQEDFEAGRLDFKRSLEESKPVSWLKSVSAFANTYGGKIIFGVTNDTHECIGIDNVQETVSKITEFIAARIQPRVQYEFNTFQGVKGKLCLSLEVFSGAATPYYYKHEQTMVAFVRHGDQSEAANSIELNNLVLRGQNLTFDQLPSRYHLTDLSFTVLNATYKNLTGSSWNGEQDRLSMHLMDNKRVLTNAGALLSDQGGLSQSRIVCTHWKGLVKGGMQDDAVDDKEYKDVSLIMLLTNAETFIANNSRNTWKITGMQRAEKSDYPHAAIREVLVNALIHRDYQYVGSEVHIDMFPDRLEVQSPGGMFSGGRIQDFNISHVPSVRRNEVISDVFGRLHYMDRRGSGLSRIMTAYQAEERQPEFSSDAYHFLVILPNRNFIGDITIKGKKPPTSEEKPPISEEKPPISEKGGDVFQALLLQHKDDFRKRNMDMLLNMYEMFENNETFDREKLSKYYGISKDGASRFLLKCVRLGIIVREKRGVYRFATNSSDSI